MQNQKRIFASDREMSLQIHLKNYELSVGEREKIEANLQSLRKLVSTFTAEMHFYIEFISRSKMFNVKTVLRLTGRTLFTGERDPLLHLACESCIRKLMHKASAYKEHLKGTNDYTKRAQGLLHDAWPAESPDIVELERAVVNGDFRVFRNAMQVFDGALALRIGRWAQRYPEADAKLGREFGINEVIDEVYLTAFERFAKRPADRLGNWLEGQIDPALKLFLRHPDAVKENTSFVKDTAPVLEE